MANAYGLFPGQLQASDQNKNDREKIGKDLVEINDGVHTANAGRDSLNYTLNNSHTQMHLPHHRYQH
jgi:hypothetical protein